MKNFLVSLIAALGVMLMASCESPVSPESVPAPLPVVTGVTITSGDLSLPKNSTYQFSAEVFGENNPPQDVVWLIVAALDGSNLVITPKPGTRIGEQSGYLSIVEDEGAVKLRIRATSIFAALADENIYGEITVTLVAPGTKIVNVESQSGILIYGAAGTATYRISTINIEDGKDISVNWVGGTPTGITDNTKNLTIASSSATLTFNLSGAPNGGKYWFTITIDGTISGQQSIEVGKRQLAAPATHTLNAQGVANWDRVPNAVSYTVQLYKDGTPRGERVANISGTTHDFLSIMREGGPGSYTVTVIAIGDGTNYGDSLESGASNAQTLARKTMVQYVWWVDNSAQAQWVNVDGDSNYTVQLYKGLNAVGSPVPVTRQDIPNPNGAAGETATTYDFSSAIAGAGNNIYYFGVIAKGDGYLILDSDEKKEERGYTHGTVQKLSQVQNVVLSNQGVATWDALTDETGVASYSIQIWKGGTPNTPEGSRITVIKGTGKTGNRYSYDMLSVLQGLTPDHYGISVKAVADDTNGKADSDDTDNTAPAAWQQVKKQGQPPYIWWVSSTSPIAHWDTLSGAGNATDYTVNVYRGETKVGATPGTGTYTEGNLKAYAALASIIDASGAGSYTFGVITKGNDYLILDSNETKDASKVYVNSTRTLPTPVNLKWNGTRAQWDAAAGAALYSVQLYKNGSASGSPVSLFETSYAGFALSAAGLYTFKVKAKGDGTNSDDSAEADSSGTDAGKLTVGGPVTITLKPLDDWSGTLGITGGGSASMVKNGGLLTINVTGGSFTSFVWVVDGDVVGGTTASITLSGTDYALGNHSVTVYALDTKSVPWSPAAPIAFTVTAN
jgi:hypothetical protein